MMIMINCEHQKFYSILESEAKPGKMNQFIHVSLLLPLSLSESLFESLIESSLFSGAPFSDSDSSVSDRIKSK